MEESSWQGNPSMQRTNPEMKGSKKSKSSLNYMTFDNKTTVQLTPGR